MILFYFIYCLSSVIGECAEAQNTCKLHKLDESKIHCIEGSVRQLFETPEIV